MQDPGVVAVANGRAICSACKRPLPRPESGEQRPARSRVTIYEPPGEAGTIDDLLTQACERYGQAWEDQVTQGEKMWRYRVLHQLLYAVVTAPNDVAARLVPSEVGA